VVDLDGGKVSCGGSTTYSGRIRIHSMLWYVLRHRPRCKGLYCTSIYYMHTRSAGKVSEMRKGPCCFMLCIVLYGVCRSCGVVSLFCLVDLCMMFDDSCSATLIDTSMVL
jgi:hypothetical protein